MRPARPNSHGASSSPLRGALALIGRGLLVPGNQAPHPTPVLPFARAPRRSYLILRIAIRQVTAGHLEDIREEEDEGAAPSAAGAKRPSTPTHKKMMSVGSMPSPN